MGMEPIEKEYRNDRGVIIRPLLSPNCAGSFDFMVDNNFSFQIHDATYDSTPVIIERFKTQQPEIPVFRKILIQFSVENFILPAVGTKKRGVDLRNNTSFNAWIHPIQDEIHIEADHLRNVRCAGRIHGENLRQRMCLYSLSLSLWPKIPLSDQEFSKRLGELQTSEGSAVHINIPLEKKRKGTKLESVHAEIGFACIDALDILQDVDWLSQPGTGKCSDSKESLMLLGSPISGPASMEDGAIDAAHFAFRALTGKVLFTSVSIAFMPTMTRSRMVFECRNVKMCIQRQITTNTRVMQHYKEIMDAEFDKLGMSEGLRRRIVVTEFCRLGGIGLLDGCNRLRASGQAAWGEFITAQMAYHHKWIGSMDMDEFIGSDPAIPGQHFRPSIEAVPFFDELSSKSENSDYIKLFWFRNVFESNAGQYLSNFLADSNRLNIMVKDKDGTIQYEPTFETCKNLDCGKQRDNGKSFSKCTNLVGTAVHIPTIISDINTIYSYDYACEMKDRNASVRVWEARKQRKYMDRGYCTLSIMESP